MTDQEKVEIMGKYLRELAHDQLSGKEREWCVDVLKRCGQWEEPSRADDEADG